MNNRSVMQYLARSAVSGALLLAGFGVLAQEAAQPSATTAGAPAAASAPAALINQGQGLFFGTLRLSAGGPPCNACHGLVHSASYGGGTLSTDLTNSADGVPDALAKGGAESPFTIMQAAFKERPLSAAELAALEAFLRDAGAKAATQKPTDAGGKMLTAGIVGVVVLLLLSALFGKGRKRRSVNREMFDRQVVSE